MDNVIGNIYPHGYFGFFGVGGWAIENQAIQIRTVPLNNNLAFAEGILRQEDPAHENANKRIIKEVVDWMETNKKTIKKINASRPLLPQLDLLTDEQLVKAIRSFDPLYADYIKKNSS